MYLSHFVVFNLSELMPCTRRPRRFFSSWDCVRYLKIIRSNVLVAVSLSYLRAMKLTLCASLLVSVHSSILHIFAQPNSLYLVPPCCVHQYLYWWTRHDFLSFSFFIIIEAVLDNQSSLFKTIYLFVVFFRASPSCFTF